MTTYDEYGIPVGAYSEPESLTHQAFRLVRAFWLYKARPALERRYMGIRRGEWGIRRLGTVTLVKVLVLVWWVVLYWGERGVFNGSIGNCDWDKWEDWEPGANPHRLIFVADPQLIDPHTYPGRPWPLNPLAYKYTDLYLRRTYSRIQTMLYPDTIFFLGDLFDGGREWSTRTSTSELKEYHKYGDDFWMNEYMRFSDIFFKHWSDAGMEARPGQPGRKIISSLPGNHDLGFAHGVQEPVRKRFEAYFGDTNRLDVIANHTFVSIDSVSLSALGEQSPEKYESIWRPTTDFLSSAKKQKHRLVQRFLRAQRGLHPYPPFEHRAIKSEELPNSPLPHADDHVTDFPTILLSHVPLYRAPGTPCGPQREHWPPTPPPPGKPPLEKDNRNAISVSGGYQYQNVLNREITADIAEKIGDIRYAFSGDDHDYCEVLHWGYTSGGGGIREITVKSTSWAMGVRHPGIVQISLWNPVKEDGSPVNGDASKTVQTHLCLFPDQIGTFIKYGLLFGATFVSLLGRAALVVLGVLRESDAQPLSSPLLPVATTSAEQEKEREKEDAYYNDANGGSHSHNSSSDSDRVSASLQVRSTQAQARTRTHSPVPGSYALPVGKGNGIGAQQAGTNGGKYAFPLVQHAGFFPSASSNGDFDKDEKRKGKSNTRVYGTSTTSKPRVRRKGVWLFLYELRTGLGRVVLFGGAWYLWLVWRG